MKNNKRIKIKIIIITQIALIIALVATVFLGQGITYAQPSDAVTDCVDEKSFSTTSIEDDFLDDTVVVVLNQQESLRVTHYSADDFPKLQIESVEEVNKNLSKIVEKQISDDQLSMEIHEK